MSISGMRGLSLNKTRMSVRGQRCLLRIDPKPSSHAVKLCRRSLAASNSVVHNQVLASQPKSCITRKDRRGRAKEVGKCRALRTAWHSLVEATLARDTAAVVVSALGGFLLVRLFDALQQAGLLKQAGTSPSTAAKESDYSQYPMEKAYDPLSAQAVSMLPGLQKTTRKCVHILAGPGLLLCWPLFSIAPYARFFAALVPALNLLRLLLIGTGVVQDEGTVMAVSREGNRQELLRGPLYYVLVLMAVTLLFWRQSPIGITVIALMCGGDGLADLIGRRYGSAKLPFNNNKSWAGSLAMFLGGWGLAVALISLFDHLGLFECTISAIAGSVAIIAACATVLESLPINAWLDDNLSVPALAAILGQYLFASSVIMLA